MKRIKLLLGALSIMAMVSCKQKEEVPVVIPVTVEAPENDPAPLPPPPPKEVPDKDGTSISIGKNGVDINTQNSTKTTEVSVNKDGAAVEIKK